MNIFSDFTGSKHALGPSKGVQGGTGEAPKRHRGPVKNTETQWKTIIFAAIGLEMAHATAKWDLSWTKMVPSWLKLAAGWTKLDQVGSKLPPNSRKLAQARIKLVQVAPKLAQDGIELSEVGPNSSEMESQLDTNCRKLAPRVYEGQHVKNIQKHNGNNDF